MTRKRTADPFATEGTATSLADRAIVIVREQPVILDSQLAELFGVTTSVLNQAVKRNADRFPSDFVIQLTPLELAALRSQFVISKGRGGRRYAPLAFTEHGAVMAATASPRDSQTLHDEGGTGVSPVLLKVAQPTQERAIAAARAGCPRSVQASDLLRHSRRAATWARRPCHLRDAASLACEGGAGS